MLVWPERRFSSKKTDNRALCRLQPFGARQRKEKDNFRAETQRRREKKKRNKMKFIGFLHLHLYEIRENRFLIRTSAFSFVFSFFLCASARESFFNSHFLFILSSFRFSSAPLRLRESKYPLTFLFSAPQRRLERLGGFPQERSP
jgi:hypothetical protein